VIEGRSIKYLGYIGSKDYSTPEIISKIQEKIASPKNKNGRSFCFEVT